MDIGPLRDRVDELLVKGPVYVWDHDPLIWVGRPLAKLLQAGEGSRRFQGWWRGCRRGISRRRAHITSSSCQAVGEPAAFGESFRSPRRHSRYLCSRQAESRKKFAIQLARSVSPRLLKAA